MKNELKQIIVTAASLGPDTLTNVITEFFSSASAAVAIVYAMSRRAGMTEEQARLYAEKTKEIVTEMIDDAVNTAEEKHGSL